MSKPTAPPARPAARRPRLFRPAAGGLAAALIMLTAAAARPRDFDLPDNYKRTHHIRATWELPLRPCKPTTSFAVGPTATRATVLDIPTTSVRALIVPMSAAVRWQADADPTSTTGHKLSADATLDLHTATFGATRWIATGGTTVTACVTFLGR